MELILLENILNLGNIGDKVKVKSGFGRNFLLKKGKALRFNKEIAIRVKIVKTTTLVIGAPVLKFETLYQNVPKYRR